jgi:hypothetical protein
VCMWVCVWGGGYHSAVSFRCLPSHFVLCVCLSALLFVRSAVYIVSAPLRAVSCTHTHTHTNTPVCSLTHIHVHTRVFDLPRTKIKDDADAENRRFEARVGAAEEELLRRHAAATKIAVAVKCWEARRVFTDLVLERVAKERVSVWSRLCDPLRQCSTGERALPFSPR